MLVSKWPKLTSLASSSSGPDPAKMIESLRTLLASLPAPLPIAALLLAVIVVGVDRGSGSGGGGDTAAETVAGVVGILIFWRRTSGGPIGVTTCGGVADEGGLLFFGRRRGDAEKFLDCCCFFEGFGEGERCRWFNLPTNAADEEASLCWRPRGELEREASFEDVSPSEKRRREMVPMRLFGGEFSGVAGVGVPFLDESTRMGGSERAVSISSPTLKMCLRSAR